MALCNICGNDAGYLYSVCSDCRAERDRPKLRAKTYAVKSKIQTHYDNLKVSRSAPIEVIRAAYRVLCQKYHPDKNQGDLGAAEIMKLINTSYQVQSDPDARRRHDAWIREAEAGQ